MEDGWNGAPVCGTSPRLRKKGEGTAVILTGYRRGGNGRASVSKKWRRRCLVWAVLGRGEKRREEGRGEVRWRAVMAPLYIGAEGEAAVGD
jgi:hypothetical protein